MPAVPVNANGAAGGAMPTIPTSVVGNWVTCHTDLEDTAESAADLLNPTSATVNATVVPIRIGQNVSKVLLRSRRPAAATITTSPVVRIYGLYCTDAVANTIDQAGTLPTDGTCIPIRLDNIDSGAAGVTITLDATNDINDGTYKYSDVISLTPIDLLGARYLMVLVETAANTSASAAQVILQALLLN